MIKCLCDCLLVFKLECATVGDPDQLSVGSGAPTVQSTAPDHHHLPRVLGHSAQLDAGGAGEQAVPSNRNGITFIYLLYPD